MTQPQETCSRSGTTTASVCTNQEEILQGNPAQGKMTFALGKRFFDEEIRRGMAVFIQATKSKLSYDIWKYMNRVFKPTFIKHGQTETEINIVDNNIDD